MDYFGAVSHYFARGLRFLDARLVLSLNYGICVVVFSCCINHVASTFESHFCVCPWLIKVLFDVTFMFASCLHIHAHKPECGIIALIA